MKMDIGKEMDWRHTLNATNSPQSSDHMSRAEALCQALREEIISGALEPGTRLREVEVAQRFGVSRTPAREALKQLKSEGLITDLPGRGLMISNPSLNEIVDAYQIREVLEGLATQLATERAVETEVSMMVATLQRAKEAHDSDDVELAVHLCVQFDGLIFAAARNPQLQSTIEMLRISHSATRARGNMRQPERRVQSIDERMAILQAILARDPMRAAEAAREHLRQARAYWVERSLQAGILG